MEGKGNLARLYKITIPRAAGPMLWVSVAFVAVFMALDMFQDLKALGGKLCVWYYSYWSYGGFGIFCNYLLPVLAALPFVAYFCTEQSNGMIPQLVSRTSVAGYGVNRVFYCALSGGLALGLGVLLHTFALSLQMPLITEDYLYDCEMLPYTQGFFTGTGLSFFFTYAYLAFLRGIIYGTLAAIVALYARHPYVAIASPLIIRFFYVRFTTFLNLPMEYYLDALYKGRILAFGEGSEGMTLLLLTGISMLFFGLGCLAFTKKLGRRLANGIFA